MSDGTPSEEQLLVAQYTGLRGEITTRTSNVFQIVQFTLVAFAAILSLAYSQAGRRDIALLYPFVAFFATLLYLANRIAIDAIGKYMREQIEVSVIRPQNRQWWETWIRQDTDIRKYVVLLEVAMTILFVGTQLLALLTPFFISSSNGASVNIGSLEFDLALAATFLTLVLLISFNWWIVRIPFKYLLERKKTSEH